MKKLVLIATLALMTSTAFAQKHMVRFYNFDNTESGTSSFDVSLGSDKIDNDADADRDYQNIALNYAYAINNMWQVGVTYKNFTNTVDGDSSATIDAESNNAGYDNGTVIGLSGYYNFDGDLTNTSYVALHYNMYNLTADSVSTDGGENFSEDDTDATATEIMVEYGRRWKIGSAWGMHLTYAPKVSYSQITWDFDALDDDVVTTDLAWNFLKFDLLF